DGDPVAVPKQRIEQGPDDDRIGDGVVVLDEAWVRQPRPPPCLAASAGKRAGVPDIPLVEAEVETLPTLDLGPDRVAGSDHCFNEVVHVYCRCQEAQRITI